MNCYKDDTAASDTNYFSVPKVQPLSKSCQNLNFEDFKDDGSDIYEFAAHAYDAVFAAAIGFNSTLNPSGGSPLGSYEMYRRFINNVSFTGATGEVQFYPGYSEYPFYNVGNRESGHTFLIYNFNEDIYDASVNGSAGFGVIGKYDGTTNEVTFCWLDDGEPVLDYEECVTPTYNTKDGSLPQDLPPYTKSSRPSVIKVNIHKKTKLI